MLPTKPRRPPLTPHCPQLEVDACLQRQGRGLKLDFSRIDGVLRLREDD